MRVFIDKQNTLERGGADAAVWLLRLLMLGPAQLLWDQSRRLRIKVGNESKLCLKLYHTHGKVRGPIVCLESCLLIKVKTWGKRCCKYVALSL